MPDMMNYHGCQFESKWLINVGQMFMPNKKPATHTKVQKCLRP